jgi:hypothetical protein
LCVDGVLRIAGQDDAGKEDERAGPNDEVFHGIPRVKVAIAAASPWQRKEWINSPLDCNFLSPNPWASETYR